MGQAPITRALHYLQPGQSTPEEAVAALGAPAHVAQSDRSTVTFLYPRFRVHTASLLLPGIIPIYLETDHRQESRALLLVFRERKLVSVKSFNPKEATSGKEPEGPEAQWPRLMDLWMRTW